MFNNIGLLKNNRRELSPSPTNIRQGLRKHSSFSPQSKFNLEAKKFYNFGLLTENLGQK
jgi:hypothetical protein